VARGSPDPVSEELLKSCHFTVTMMEMLREQLVPAIQAATSGSELEGLEVALRSVQARAQMAIDRAERAVGGWNHRGEPSQDR
jgi:hypothetical protein